MLFLAPCLVLAGLCFRAGERRWTYGVLVLAIIGYGLVSSLFSQPSVMLTASGAAALYKVNVISVACLMALIGITFAGAMRRPDDEMA